MCNSCLSLTYNMNVNKHKQRTKKHKTKSNEHNRKLNRACSFTHISLSIYSLLTKEQTMMHKSQI